MTLNKRAKQSYRKPWRQKLVHGSVFLFFVFGTFLFWRIEVYGTILEEAQLRVWFFDVGQGDAIFIETENKKRIMIDSGRDNHVLSKIGMVVPPWDRDIHAIIETHPDSDHITGFIEVLNRYDVQDVYLTGQKSDTEIKTVFDNAIVEEGASVKYVRSGDLIILDDVVLEIFAPDESLVGKKLKDKNEGSVIIKVTYGETTLLLTGDLPTAVEYELLSKQFGEIDVLQIPHHGSVYSTSPAFLKKINPEVSVISVGKNNYGHPHPVVIDRIENSGSNIYRTDKDGDILIQSVDGETIVKPNPLIF